MNKGRYLRPTFTMLETLAGLNEMLENDEDTTIPDIARFLGIAYNTAYQRLRNYLVYNLVEVDEDGNFSITDEGYKFLEEYG